MCSTNAVIGFSWSLNKYVGIIADFIVFELSYYAFLGVISKLLLLLLLCSCFTSAVNI